MGRACILCSCNNPRTDHGPPSELGWTLLYFHLESWWLTLSKSESNLLLWSFDVAIQLLPSFSRTNSLWCWMTTSYYVYRLFFHKKYIKHLKALKWNTGREAICKLRWHFYAKIKANPLDIIHAFYIDWPWFVWTDDEPEILFFRSSYIQNQQSYLMMNSIVKNITTKLSIISIMKTIHGNWTLPSESWREVKCDVHLISIGSWSFPRRTFCSSSAVETMKVTVDMSTMEREKSARNWASLLKLDQL